MDHLTEEQFEELLAGSIAPPDHLSECIECKARLAEKRALADRLRTAFGSISASDDLVQRVRVAVNPAGTQAPKQESPIRMRFVRLHRQLFSRLAAAAAILIILVPAGFYLSTSSQAHAAQVELVNIHQHNLGEHHGFVQSSDPNTLSEFFMENLGHVPASVCTSQGLSLRGCCVHAYRDQRVGSYVIITSDGNVSVIMLNETPKALRMKKQSSLSSPEVEIWGATCDCCNMAARRMGDQTYYALGEVPQETLAKVLGQLL